MVGRGRAPSNAEAPGELPSGEDGLAREQVADIQRARILSAMGAVASEYGVGYATVARVVARSGVSRRTFYEQFVDREDCFLAAFDQAVEKVAAVVVPAYRRPSRWREGIRAGLTVLLQFLDFEDRVGRLVIVETLGAGPRVLERRQQVLAQLIAVIDGGRKEARRGKAPPPLTAEGLAGGALSLIHSRIGSSSPPHSTAGSPRGDPAGDSLLGLLNPLVSMIVLPYLGPAAAGRELDRLVPRARSDAKRAGEDPLRDLDMRLTYRTIRVLEAIGALGEQGPHPSNRQVADAAGIRDQGQVSKLLARLQQLGLVENAGETRAKGEPNKWQLTQRGDEVRRMVSV